VLIPALILLLALFQFIGIIPSELANGQEFRVLVSSEYVDVTHGQSSPIARALLWVHFYASFALRVCVGADSPWPKQHDARNS